MSIPTIVLEEHHEALPVWNLAVQRGLMPQRGNLLLHVDEHSDLEAPRLRQALPEVTGDIRVLTDLTYDQMAINEFIVAAVFQGLFDSVYWVRQGIKERKEQRVFVHSERGERQKLVLTPEAPAGGSDAREFLFVAQSTRPEIPVRDALALDIDLDFFSSDQAEHRVDRIEVTQEQFAAFQQDRYHHLRLDFGSRISALREQNRYYFYFRKYENTYPCRSKASPEAIDARFTLLDRLLERSSVRPRVITIARSRISGYTPADQWKDIENELLTRLERHFELTRTTIDSWLGE